MTESKVFEFGGDHQRAKIRQSESMALVVRPEPRVAVCTCTCNLRIPIACVAPRRDGIL